MMCTEREADPLLQRFALRDVLVMVLGWTPAAPEPREVAVDRDVVALTPLARADARLALQHLTPLGDRLPDPIRRRAIARAVRGALGGDALIVFTDVLRTAQVWQWTEPLAGGGALYREECYRPGRPAAALLARLARLARGGPLGRLAADRAVSDAVAAVVLPALLRRVGRFYRAAPASASEADALAAGLREAVEAAPDPRLLRAVWRALGRLTVFDPACGDGERLVAAAALLAPLHDACIEQMRIGLAELERSRGRHRPEKLADFRAVVERADDVRRYATREEFVLTTLLRHTLHGADPEPRRAAACRQRLLGLLGGRAAAGLAPELALNIRTGDAARGFASAEAVRRALGGRSDAAAVFRRLDEEAETLDRALRLQRWLRASAEPDATEATGCVGRRAAAALRARRRRAAAELDALLATAARDGTPRARPLHLWLEFHGIIRRGGFDAVLPAAPAAPATARVREAAGSFGPPAAPLAGPAAPEADEPRRIERGAGGYPAALEQRLGEAAPPTLTLRGNAELLRLPLLALFCSVRLPERLVLPALDLARGLREAGIATVGGFQSPLEKEWLALLLRGTQPVVVSPARGLETMRLPAAWREPLRQRRLLVVSRFAAAQRRVSAALAERRNTLVGALAEQVVIAHPTPGGRLHRLARTLLARGQPVLTLADAHNADLLRLGARPVEEAIPRLRPER